MNGPTGSGRRRRRAGPAPAGIWGDALRAARHAADAIRRRWDCAPRAAVILGTGIGGVADHVDRDVTLAYQRIPHFPRSTAPAHQGQLVCGRLGGVPVAVMQGRCHRYEGHTLAELALPVWAFKELGIELLVLSNASGGLNPRYRSGDVMIMEDHIDLMFWKPAWGMTGPSRTAEEAAAGGVDHPACAVPVEPMPRTGRPLGPVYDPVLIGRAMAIARRVGFAAHRGVYAAMTGPCYETRAEYRFLRTMGADAVGMSTVPEAWAASRCGLRTLGLSTITNVARPDRPQPVLPQQVVRAAERAEPHLRRIVVEILAALSSVDGGGMEELESQF